MRGCERMGKRIGAGAALERDEEGFISGQAGGGQQRDFIAQLRFAHSGLRAAGSGVAVHVFPPPGNLRFEGWVGVVQCRGGCASGG